MLSRILKPLLLGLMVSATGLVLSFVPFSHELEEDAGLGLLFKLRGPRPPPLDAVVISIDKESADQLQIPHNPDRWPRSLHARLVNALTQQGASVITFDVHFIEARDKKDDQLFAQALSRAGNVVLGDALTTKEVPAAESPGAGSLEHSILKIIKPYELFRAAALANAPFVLPRLPFKVNKFWLFQTEAELSPPPTFPAVAYQLYCREVYDEFIRLLERARPGLAAKLPANLATAMATKSVAKLMRAIKDLFENDPALAAQMLAALERPGAAPLGPRPVAMLKGLIKMYGDDNQRYLNYYGPPHTVATLPYYRVLGAGAASERKAIDVKGKAVFVGLSERLLAERKDSFYTVFSQARGVFIGGVEIAATAFLNMIEDRPVSPIGAWPYVAVILGWGLTIGAVCRMSSMMFGAAIGLGLSALYLLTAFLLFKADGTWIPIVIPLFAQSPLAFAGAVLWSYAETNKERHQIRKALAYYVPDEVVDQLAKNMVDIKNSGSMVYGACLFADVAGYTTLSEKMSPKQLSDLMHKYFEATFAPVKKHGGIVVNLKGDSFLAIWKAARADDGLRRQACLAALGVAEAVHRFNGTVANLDLPTRVGVHSGEIFIGNIGAGDHYEYGPTGDTVNTASRMDGLNKYLGTEVLVSAEAIANLSELAAREVGTFMLKGKAVPMVVYELLGELEESDEPQKQACALFADALSEFKRQAWDEAKVKFERAAALREADGPSHFYLRLCAEHKSHPPGESWDGVITLDEK